MPKPIIAVTATCRRETPAVPPRVRLGRAYLEAVACAGGVPLLTVAVPGADPADLLDAVHGVLLTGGEDVDPRLFGAEPHPALGRVTADRDAWEIGLVQAAHARGVPVFGVCRGIQVLAVALGGTLIQDIPAERPHALSHDQAGERSARSHPVSVEAGSRMATLIGESAAVNSMHHQAIAASPAGLAVTASAPDGIIEAVEWTADDWWALGVQWHPEELDGAAGRGLFTALVEAAAGRRRSPGLPPRRLVGHLTQQALG